MTIIKATIAHLEDLIPLFDGYRMFYRQASNHEAVRDFLKDRFIKQDSVIFTAYKNKKAVGFTQLYVLLSSVSMMPMYVLNDLYIHPDYRGNQIGTSLINRAKSHCRIKNYKGLIIQTGATNPAQHLYEREGFVKDHDLYLFWSNPSLNTSSD